MDHNNLEKIYYFPRMSHDFLVWSYSQTLDYFMKTFQVFG